MNIKKYLLLIFLFLYACTPNLKQPSNKIEFYTLEYDPPKISASDKNPLPHIIKIERFSMAPEYNTNQMIYRDNPFRRNAYNYHAWRANPGDLTSYFLSRDMKYSGLFKGVLSPDSRSAYSHILEGSVDEFFEWDGKNTWKAVLTVSIALMMYNEPDISKRIIFQRTYNLKEACKQKSPSALAEAMSQAMSKLSGAITRDTYNKLKQRKVRVP